MAHCRRSGASAIRVPISTTVAQNSPQAIAFHGGEATAVAHNYSKLTAPERRQLEAFMKSLKAPAPADLVASAK